MVFLASMHSAQVLAPTQSVAKENVFMIQKVDVKKKKKKIQDNHSHAPRKTSNPETKTKGFRDYFSSVLRNEKNLHLSLHSLFLGRRAMAVLLVTKLLLMCTASYV